MKITCKNCSEHFSGNYCPNCGQSARTSRLNLIFLLKEIQIGIFLFDRGLLYTIKELFVRPGHTIREYIEGKRISHFKPISFVVVVATAYSLLKYYLAYRSYGLSITGTINKELSLETISHWISNHYSIVTLMKIPFFAMGSFLLFRNYRYNFIEHLTLNLFLSGQRVVFHMFIDYPCSFIPIETEPDILKFLMGLSMKSLPDFILIFLSYHQFFKNTGWIKTFWRTIGTSLISMIFMIVFSALFLFAASAFHQLFN